MTSFLKELANEMSVTAVAEVPGAAPAPAKMAVEHLNLFYGDFQGLRDVNLTFPENQVTALIGPSGCGKSTLLKTLNRMNDLVEGCRVEGSVLLDGADAYRTLDATDLRRRVGMVFQYPEHQLFEETVLKDISFGPSNMGLEPAEIEKRARDAAKFVGLREELLEKSPFELSGGEKRRVAIAGVIAMDPDVLILDEPTAGLDPRGRDVLLSQIVNYHEVRHNTILLVSHSMEDIARTADRILVMNGGHVRRDEEGVCTRGGIGADGPAGPADHQDPRHAAKRRLSGRDRPHVGAGDPAADAVAGGRRAYAWLEMSPWGNISPQNR